MSQPNNVIKLGLPPQISNFTFSYETKQPGPVTITIAVGGEPSKAVADVPVQSTSAGEPVIVLDQWRAKPRVDGEYTDIFDGSMCRTQLKGPDGELFFSNRPHEKSGPDGELRIGVNLGVDW
ncbi:hypothetical protein PAXINDRAFT_18738 [Paxillus involutus ATCC 200175]|uniref:Uncharacterized protein n=1 Tax=Paxillus involutus ATCC 200175 TaxID=664439 RepID=A0A0C9TLA4_PAXIN|nr:hypothetical protein PAXINDRAFT_18738 [Paxillus involutus ATCC 200175]